MAKLYMENPPYLISESQWIAHGMDDNYTQSIVPGCQTEDGDWLPFEAYASAEAIKEVLLCGGMCMPISWEHPSLLRGFPQFLFIPVQAVSRMANAALTSIACFDSPADAGLQDEDEVVRVRHAAGFILNNGLDIPEVEA